MSDREKTIKRALAILFASSRKETIINLIILIVRSFIPLAALFLIKYYIDRITGSEGDTLASSFSMIAWLVVAIAVILLADDLLSYAGNYLSKKQSYLLEGHIAGLIHRQASLLGLRYFEDPSFHDRLSRAERDISWRPAAMLSDLVTLLRGLISFLAMAYVLGTFGIVPLAVLAVVFIPVLWLKVRNAGKIHGVRKEVTQDARQASYFSWLLTGEKPAREIRLFNLSQFFSKLFRRHFAASREPEIRVIRDNSLAEGLASVIKVVAFGGVLIYATYSFVRSEISAGELAVYIIAFRQALVYLREAVSGVSGLAENRLYLGDLFYFLDLTNDMLSENEAVSHDSFSIIDIKNLTFTYPGATRPALENINLTIRKGERLAIVGPNGSGKTTLVKLLCRLYDPGQGDIFLNGKNIRRYDLAEYRKLFSVVFQDFMLYYLSAADNICLSAGGEAGSRERMEGAASKAGVASVLESLPDGYGTMLGHHSEGGRELSWGEWQKIAIARAIYREAPVLIMDEPSSSLDADTEYEIFSDPGRITGDRTTIFISHRLANIRSADRIVVLDKGRVVETGSHEELMDARGRYYLMFTRQKSMYR